MKPIKCLNLRGASILSQLCTEELLLRNTSSNWMIFNTGIPEKAIVLGLSGKINELVQTNKAKEDRIQLIRRYTGGGTVIVDKNTIFCSLIMNSTDIDSKPFPRELMSWSEKIYAPVFKSIDNNLKFALRENDYVLGNRKIGGNAQTITKDRIVHHTSFLYDFDEKNMDYLQMPKKRPEYRSERSHLEFLTTLSAHLKDPSVFEEYLKLSLSSQYSIEDVSQEEYKRIEKSILRGKNINEVARSREVIIEE